MIPILVWRQPPPPRGNTSRPRDYACAPWAEILQRLTVNPGVWALIAEGRPNEACPLANQVMVASVLLGEGRWEARSVRKRLPGPGKPVVEVYARYVGPPGDAP